VIFKSRSVKAASEEGKYEVAGELTMHGQTKPVTITLEKVGASSDRIGFEGILDINKKDFGIQGVQGLGDDIRLIIAFQGVKKK
jgi:polyisoprenoid-binding protein YceI